MKRKSRRRLKKKTTPSHIRIDDEVQICVNEPVSIKIENIAEYDTEAPQMQPCVSNVEFNCSSQQLDVSYETQKKNYPYSSDTTSDGVEVSQHLSEPKYSASNFENASMNCDDFSVVNTVIDKAIKSELIENQNYSNGTEQQFNLGRSSLVCQGSDKEAHTFTNIYDSSIAKKMKCETEECLNGSSDSNASPLISSDKVDTIQEAPCKKIKSEPDVYNSSSQRNCDKILRQSKKNVCGKKNLRDCSKKSNEMLTPKTGNREIDQLYKSLQEISWANDKSFTTLLYSKDSLRHSDRVSVAKASKGKKCIKSEQENDSTKSSCKKLNLSNRTQNPVTRVRKCRSTDTKKNKKRKNDEATSSKVLPALEMKKSDASTSVNTRSKKVDCNKCEGNKPDTGNLKALSKRSKKTITRSRKKGKGRSSKRKAGEQKVRIKIEKDISETGTSQAAEMGSLDVDKNKTSDQIKQPAILQPPAKSWATEYIGFPYRTLQERMLSVVSSADQRHISPVLREAYDSRSSKSSKNCRKRRFEEEAVRSSVRQSECAFRYKEIVVKKYPNYLQVILVPNTHKQNCLTLGAMKELKETLQSARRDPNCKAILLNSSGSFFCSGIDMRHLCANAKKHNAEEMAVMIRDLILTFAIFPKPILAAVNGCAIGLGVAILTYCDIVIASDKASFSIPSTFFGYIPEGGVSLTLPQVVGSTVATEMLLHGRRLTAPQALRCGLVSEVVWPTRLMEEVFPRIQLLVQQSLPAMEATKTMLRCHLWEKLALVLNNEGQVLIRQWPSNICQQKMKQHLKTGWTEY